MPIAANELEQRLFGYDAVTESNRRRPPSREMRSDDNLLRSYERDKMTATSRDSFRNYVLVKWMIRKHQDFVSDFTFNPNTPSKEFNEALRKLMKKQCKKNRCHVSKRHPLRRLLRIQEACRALDGDVLIEKMRSRAIGIIRADQIRNPRGIRNNNEWTNGVRINTRNKAAIEFQIHTRKQSGRFVEDKRIPARNAILNGYWPPDADQIRGVSELAVGLNTLRDTYEGIDYALARLKIEQLFGTVITKKSTPDGTNPFVGNRQFDDNEDGTEKTDAEKKAAAKEEDKRGFVDFGPGIFQTELDFDEDMKILAGNMPSSNAQSFINNCMYLALKSLDIPISFYDESHTNFHGSRGSLQHYKRSCQSKQEDNADVLEELTEWWMTHWIVDGELDLPRGWKLEDIEYTWVPRGIPWWDRSKEIIGDLRAIAAGLDNPIDICLDHGTNDPFKNIDETAKVLEYGREKLSPFGLNLSFDASQTSLEAIEEAVANASNN